LIGKVRHTNNGATSERRSSIVDWALSADDLHYEVPEVTLLVHHSNARIIQHHITEKLVVSGLHNQEKISISNKEEKW
jgi:hypothetical protein